MAAKTCFNCQHYDEPVRVCRVFDEQIDSEIFAAEECPAYERDGR